MATTAARELPGQEPPKPAPVGVRNIDTLQSMMNLLLIQAGRFIKEHQSGGGVGRQRAQFRNVVPIATERFQDALDELENEVRLAQTVLRRDLALLRQDRKKREIEIKEKEAEKARLAAESKTQGSAAKPEEVKVDKVSSPAPPPEAHAEKEPEQRAEPEKPLESEDSKIPPPIETSIAEPTERDPLFDGTPTTANPQDNDFDFDAIFGDAMDTSADNNNVHDDMMDTSGDMGFDFDNDDDQGSSLLPGLEDFAKSGDDNDNNNNNNNNNNAAAQNTSNMDIDMTIGDLPDLNTAITGTEAPPAPQTELPAPPKPAEAPPPPAPPEPAANDAAPDNDTANDDLMGGMVTDNLDDLFNMDDYENPENSSFDDAFFNFE